MKVTSLIFASMVATAAAHPVSVACTDDDTATTMRVGGVMMGVTVAAAPSDGATLTVTKARVADVYYLHVDNIPTADFFAVRTQGNAVRSGCTLIKIRLLCCHRFVFVPPIPLLLMVCVCVYVCVCLCVCLLSGSVCWCAGQLDLPRWQHDQH